MKKEHSNYEKSYRDSLATIAESGKRIWVYAKQPKGILYKYRSGFAAFLLALLFTVPFIKFNDVPFILLNVFERKFILFGVVFWPQDSYLFALMMISLIVFVVLFTVSFGRIWCGWACPQTIFLEHIFRRLEFWIEGTPAKQQKLKDQAWDFEKIWKKTLKNGLYIAISLLIIHTLASYLISADEVLANFREGFAENKKYFGVTSFLSLAFYFVYSWLREQVCTIVCPYGRLQGVLLDSNSILVSYDYIRGEPRGKFRKSENRKSENKGDCIDCKQCVQVCPTHIDIRNGTQLECVQCTACIDACNSAMKSVNKPKGLIRYSSENGIAKGEKLKFNIRIAAYTGVLLAILTFLTVLLSTRTEIETTILRTQGTLYQDQPDGRVSNLYNYKIINKSYDNIEVEIRLVSHTGDITIPQGQVISVPPNKRVEGVLFAHLELEILDGRKTNLTFGVFKNNEQIETFGATFIGPGDALLTK